MLLLLLCCVCVCVLLDICIILYIKNNYKYTYIIYVYQFFAACTIYILYAHAINYYYVTSVMLLPCYVTILCVLIRCDPI